MAQVSLSSHTLYILLMCTWRTLEIFCLEVFQVTGLKILGRIGTHIFLIFFFW